MVLAVSCSRIWYVRPLYSPFSITTFFERRDCSALLCPVHCAPLLLRYPRRTHPYYLRGFKLDAQCYQSRCVYLTQNNTVPPTLKTKASLKNLIYFFFKQNCFVFPLSHSRSNGAHHILTRSSHLDSIWTGFLWIQEYSRDWYGHNRRLKLEPSILVPARWRRQIQSWMRRSIHQPTNQDCQGGCTQLPNWRDWGQDSRILWAVCTRGVSFFFFFPLDG